MDRSIVGGGGSGGSSSSPSPSRGSSRKLPPRLPGCQFTPHPSSWMELQQELLDCQRRQEIARQEIRRLQDMLRENEDSLAQIESQSARMNQELGDCGNALDDDCWADDVLLELRACEEKAGILDAALESLKKQ